MVIKKNHHLPRISFQCLYYLGSLSLKVAQRSHRQLCHQRDWYGEATSWLLQSGLPMGDGQGYVLTHPRHGLHTPTLLPYFFSHSGKASLHISDSKTGDSNSLNNSQIYRPLDNKLVPCGYRWWQEFKCKQAPRRRKTAHRVNQDFPKRAILRSINSQS